MGKIRAPFQGVWNIIRFNWQFYVLAGCIFLILLLLTNYAAESVGPYLFVLDSLLCLPVFISVIVSWYVYDLSDLYQLDWVDNSTRQEKRQIINIHAGFDETSALLSDKFPDAELEVFDFYDPKKHTEISIRRARKAYPPFPNTQQVTTARLPLNDNSADQIFIIFAAHEIRDESERIAFFVELKRVLKPTGKIFVTEHLRDIPNFLSYNIGYLHFYAKSTWLKIFKSADLVVKKEQKITSLVSTFTLTKYGVTP